MRGAPRGDNVILFRYTRAGGRAPGKGNAAAATRKPDRSQMDCFESSRQAAGTGVRRPMRAFVRLPRCPASHPSDRRGHRERRHLGPARRSPGELLAFASPMPAATSRASSALSVGATASVRMGETIGEGRQFTRKFPESTVRVGGH
jgi:hypothetical protein